MSRRRRTVVGRPEHEGDLSYDVRIWSIRVNEGRRRKTYSVRWIVGGREHHETFATRALADAHRAKLLSYVNKGVAFDRTSGLPEPMLRQQRDRTWYEHMCSYMDMKWPLVAPKSRRSIADALTTVTPAMLSSTRGMPDPAVLRAALLRWVLVTPARKAGGPPEDLVSAVRWLEDNTVRLALFEDRVRGPELTRAALDLVARRLDGRPAAPTTVARKRAVLYNVLAFAVESGLLQVNPIDVVSWSPPSVVTAVDRRSVVNPDQARRLLRAVGEQGEVGRRLVAFFALMYYAGLRPSEALGFRGWQVEELPESGWGELTVGPTTPRAGARWTDTGRSREDRGLKHRPVGEVRHPPAHPELVALLRAHVRQFGIKRDERLFVGRFGGLIDEATYLSVWRAARRTALTDAEVRSPLAARPYDLRHAAVSTWLNAGVPATQVAEWAGHSVAVLLRTYAKCIVGQDQAARRRIEEALGEALEEADTGPDGAGEQV